MANTHGDLSEEKGSECPKKEKETARNGRKRKARPPFRTGGRLEKKRITDQKKGKGETRVPGTGEKRKGLLQTFQK